MERQLYTIRVALAPGSPAPVNVCFGSLSYSSRNDAAPRARRNFEGYQDKLNNHLLDSLFCNGQFGLGILLAMELEMGTTIAGISRPIVNALWIE